MAIVGVFMGRWEQRDIFNLSAKGGVGVSDGWKTVYRNSVYYNFFWYQTKNKKEPRLKYTRAFSEQRRAADKLKCLHSVRQNDRPLFQQQSRPPSSQKHDVDKKATYGKVKPSTHKITS